MFILLLKSSTGHLRNCFLITILQWMQTRVILVLWKTHYIIKLGIAPDWQVSFCISSICTNVMLKGYKTVILPYLSPWAFWAQCIIECLWISWIFCQQKRDKKNLTVDNILANDINKTLKCHRNIYFCQHLLFNLCTLTLLLF